MKHIHYFTLLIVLSIFSHNSLKAELLCKDATNDLSQTFEELTDSKKTSKSFIEVLHAFSKGLIPDLTNTNQKKIYDLYLALKFGSESSHIKKGSLDRLGKLLDSHPKLAKESFDSYSIKITEEITPTSYKLNELVKETLANSKNLIDVFYQFSSSLHYWEKIFLFKDSTYENRLKEIENLSKKERKKQKTLAIKAKKINFLKHLEDIIPLSKRTIISNPKTDTNIRASLLYEHLVHQRKIMTKNNIDTKAISQAIVDLIFTIGLKMNI